MIKGILSNSLRRLGLLGAIDHIRYRILKFRERHRNRRFRMEHPDVALPPDDLMYETFRMDYAKYYHDSARTAEWLIGLLEKHVELEEVRILDWGCGPGRIIRHLPRLLGNGCSYHGTDYNPRIIQWCREHLPGIAFNLNGEHAELPYPDQHFDVIYGISIFTHLAEPSHHAWYAELMRVLRPGGIMLQTAQGDAFKDRLTKDELRRYNAGELVVRGDVKEGHRLFSAFHPPAYMRKMFKDAEILDHIPDPGSQDVWIIRRPSPSASHTKAPPA